MQQFRLIPHSSTPCEFIRSVSVNVARESADQWILAYSVEGDIERLRVPPPGTPARTDGLWRETCFEVFLCPGASGAYDEFNFAPSGAWAGYRFDDYRHGMRPIEPMQTPAIRYSSSARTLQMDVRLTIALPMEHAARIALASVLQDVDDQVSYWALAHAAGKPDFHNVQGFAAAPDR
ncbi:MAG TPA: DOMON-like domain-containing protein [Steroidobacteraceae bacterium]|jgi:hypothetical protein